MSDFKRYCKIEGRDYIVVRLKGEAEEDGLPLLYKIMFIFNSLSYEEKTEINKFCIMLFELLPLHVREDIDKLALLRQFIGEFKSIKTINHLKFKNE